MGSEVRYTITQAAELLDRSPHTLRSWDRNGSMPKSLRPKRDSLGHRYWTPELIAKIKEWIVKNHFHPGRGIDYDPSPEQLAAHITKIRSSSHRADQNGAHGELRKVVEQAIIEMKLPTEQILSNLPSVAQQSSVSLEDAIIITADVLSSR